MTDIILASVCEPNRGSPPHRPRSSESGIHRQPHHPNHFVQRLHPSGSRLDGVEHALDYPLSTPVSPTTFCFSPAALPWVYIVQGILDSSLGRATLTIGEGLACTVHVSSVYTRICTVQPAMKKGLGGKRDETRPGLGLGSVFAKWKSSAQKKKLARRL